MGDAWDAHPEVRWIRRHRGGFDRWRERRYGPRTISFKEHLKPAWDAYPDYLRLPDAVYENRPAPGAQWAAPAPMSLLPPPQVGMSTLDRVVAGAVVDPVGRPTGQLWTIPVTGQHLLIAGLPGAGKSSLIWSMMLGLGPAIRDGLCEVWAFDPKLGMELGMGEALFTHLECVEDYAGVAKLLDELVTRMRSRARLLKGVVRKHTPTVTEPQIVVLIDELAAIVAYLNDSKLKGQINKALALLLSQGRAPGVTVIGASQDPRKEVLDLRDLFTTRVGLRLGSRTQVDMVLGAGAREAGAECDSIPAGLPGMAYVLGEDGLPVRVRAFWNDDTAVRQLAADYRRSV